MDSELLRQIADVGYPLAILIFAVWGARRMWLDFWPWVTGTYWPAREARWQQEHQTQEDRDRRITELSERYIEALERYQNGFASAAKLDHERLYSLINNNSNRQLEALGEMTMELKGWRAEALQLIALMEGRHTDEN